VIEGLDQLTQLEDLTLFNNQIQRLENMDTLTKLHVFSVGNNDLKELDNVGMFHTCSLLLVLSFHRILKDLMQHAVKTKIEPGNTFHCRVK